MLWMVRGRFCFRWQLAATVAVGGRLCWVKDRWAYEYLKR